MTDDNITRRITSYSNLFILYEKKFAQMWPCVVTFCLFQMVASWRIVSISTDMGIFEKQIFPHRIIEIFQGIITLSIRVPLRSWCMQLVAPTFARLVPSNHTSLVRVAMFCIHAIEKGIRYLQCFTFRWYMMSLHRTSSLTKFVNDFEGT